MTYFGDITFELAAGWLAAVPVAAALCFAGWQQRRAGLSGRRVIALGLVRSLAFIPLLCLAARPVWVTKAQPANRSREVVLLLDRSESMSLEEKKSTRYEKATAFLRDQLLPALKSAKLPVLTMLFAENAETAENTKLAGITPKGRRTNLGGAIAQALTTRPQTPLGIIALTDGIANESADNRRALTSLVDSQVPFIGLGFGNDEGVRTLSLREVQAPPTISTKTTFAISAQLEMSNAEEMPAFDLLLYRDGQLTQKKNVEAGKGSRIWLENFQLVEDLQGVHNYTIQVLPPTSPNLKCVNLTGSTSVRISDEKELRVLYIQGALTWDYKFINLALHPDQTIKITGLTRTSKQSVFRQNVESAAELTNGFPSTLAELAPFRLVVLSNLRPVDFSTAQQDVLARFCGELGGGVLMIGGSDTFDSSWQHSRLEQLLPVVFASKPEVHGVDRPFRLQLTEEATREPIFQIADDEANREAWMGLPTFTQYGQVDGLKPGAQPWMLHPSDSGPHGKRILMASQRYGAGLSAVLTIQSFWRWRLAKDSNPQQFDRFWRQLFRYLSEAGRQEVAIHLADQDLHPDMDVRVLLEQQPNPKSIGDPKRKFLVQVDDGSKKLVLEEGMELEPLHPAEIKFHAGKAGVYTVTVLDSLKVPISSRTVEIHDINVEFQDTARNMETLRQWASASGGLAFKVEECPNGNDLVDQIRGKIEEVRQGQQRRQPIGVNGWIMALVLACLSLEWLVRRKWDLV